MIINESWVSGSSTAWPQLNIELTFFDFHVELTIIVGVARFSTKRVDL